MDMSTKPEELACIYCAAILADDDIPITADKISTLLKAAKVDVESIWPVMYAKALSGVNVRELITNVKACSAGPGVGGSQIAGTAQDGGVATEDKEGKPEEKKEEENAVSDDEDSDMGLDLFGD